MLIVAILIAILAGLVWYSKQQTTVRIEDAATTTPTTTTAGVYSSDIFGIRFRYPTHYFLEEREVGNAERAHYLVMLTEDTEENRLVREGKAPGREGPIAITLDVFQNMEQQSVESFIKNTSQTNYKLGDGVLTKTKVGTRDALSYRWSGLYEGRSVAFVNGPHVFLWSVTWLTPDDRIIKDFDEMVRAAEIGIASDEDPVLQ